MNYIKTSYNKYSKLYNIIFLIISISITLGFIVSFCLEKELINSIYDYFIMHINNFNKYILNNLTYPIIIYISIFLISLTFIGFIWPFLALFIENMSIGLFLGIMLRKVTLKGLIKGTIYIILTKLFYIIILIYLIINIYKFINQTILSIKNKKDNSIYNLYSKIIIKVIFSIIIITLYNILNIFITPYIVKLLIFK